MEQSPTDREKEGSLERQAESDQPREQWFHFGPWVFDVRKARAIVGRFPREPRPIPVEPWARFYGLTERVEDSFPLFGPRELNKDYALTTDLNDPVLIATMRNADGEEFPLLIDGTHRLYRAYAEGLESLPTHVLTAEETLTIREDGLIGGSGFRGSGPRA